MASEVRFSPDVLLFYDLPYVAFKNLLSCIAILFYVCKSLLTNYGLLRAREKGLDGVLEKLWIRNVFQYQKAVFIWGKLFTFSANQLPRL